MYAEVYVKSEGGVGFQCRKENMICNNCGAENKEAAKFCKNCGKEIVKIQAAPEMNFQQAADVNSQPSQAVNYQQAPTGRTCPACGSPAGPNAVFCKKCGHKIEEPVSAVSDDEMTTVLQPDSGDNYGYAGVSDSITEEKSFGGNAQNIYAQTGYDMADKGAGYSVNGIQYKYTQENANKYESANTEVQADYNQYASAQSSSPVYYNDIAEDQLPPRYKPIGSWAYFGWSVVFALPIAGLVIAIVFAVGSTENINLRNYARSMFCFWAIIGILFLLIFASVGCSMTGLLY